MDLECREAGKAPAPKDYSSMEEWSAAWHLWRALRRDAQLNEEERMVSARVTFDWINNINN